MSSSARISDGPTRDSDLKRGHDDRVEPPPGHSGQISALGNFLQAARPLEGGRSFVALRFLKPLL